MENFWFFDENFSKFLLKNKNYQSFWKKNKSVLSKEVMELFKFNGFIVLCSPHFSGLTRLFSENNRNLVKIFLDFAFLDRKAKKKIASNILNFGIGFFLIFLKTNLVIPDNLIQNKNFPPFLCRIENKMKNLIQKKFGSFLLENKNFSLFLISKGILEETFQFIKRSNPFCVWWTNQLVFIEKNPKKFKNQKSLIGLIKSFLNLNPGFFTTKKTGKGSTGGKNFFENYWTICLYENSSLYLSHMLFEVFFNCEFLLKRKKIEILRKIIVYSKYFLTYIGLKSNISLKPTYSRISFANRVFDGFFCLSETEKGRRESSIRKTWKIFSRQIEIQRNRKGDFFPKASEKLITKTFEKFQFWGPKNFWDFEKINKTNSVLFRHFSFKLSPGTDSLVNFLITKSFLERIFRDNLTSFFRDIIENGLLSEFFFKFFFSSLLFLLKTFDLLHEKQINKIAEQSESFVEFFFSRKKNQISSDFFLSNNYGIVSWDFKKLEKNLNSFYLKKFSLKRKRKKLINPAFPFFFFLTKGINFDITELLIRKKQNYISLKKLKLILCFFGSFSDNGKYIEAAFEFSPKKCLKTKYFLSSWLYHKGKFDSSYKQINFILETGSVYKKSYFLAGLISTGKKNFWESIELFSKILKKEPFNKHVWEIFSYSFLKFSVKKTKIVFVFQNLIPRGEVSFKLFETILIFFFRTEEMLLSKLLEIIAKFSSKNTTNLINNLKFLRMLFIFFSEIFNKKVCDWFLSQKEKFWCESFFYRILKDKHNFNFFLFKKFDEINRPNRFKIFNNKHTKLDKKVYGGEGKILKLQKKICRLETFNRMVLSVKKFKFFII